MDVGVIILQTCAVCCLDVSMWHCHGWSVRNRFTLVRIPCPFWCVCFQCNSKHVTAAVRIRKAESSVLALASAPVVKRNIGSTTRAVRDFRDFSQIFIWEKFCRCCIPSFCLSWIFCFENEMLTAESCHCRSHELWPILEVLYMLMWIRGGCVLGLDEPLKCAPSSTSLLLSKISLHTW